MLDPLRRAVVTTVVAVSVALLAPPGPASAGYRVDWTYDSRPHGLPAASDPASTLAGATSQREFGDPWGADPYVAAEIVLAGEPAADSDTELHVVFGDLVDGVCVAEWEIAFSTFAPAAPATRDGATISFDVPAEPWAADQLCSFVELLEPSTGTTLDRLDGRVTGGAISDPGEWLRLRAPDERTVPTRTWVEVRVRVRVLHDDIDRVVLTPSGRDVRSRKVVVGAGRLADGRAVARVPVRLADVRQERRLVIYGRATGDGEWFANDRIGLVLVPRA